MIMRFNEIHKFSDGTLQQIDEALDYRVKEFQINRTNPGMNTRFWTKKDVDRSKDFMFAIQKRLKTRRIFRNLESFVGGRIREGDYRYLSDSDLIHVVLLSVVDKREQASYVILMVGPHGFGSKDGDGRYLIPVESIIHQCFTLNVSNLVGPVGTDIAKISRKQSKSNNQEHGNGIECAKAGECYQRSGSKWQSYTSPSPLIGGNPQGNHTWIQRKNAKK
ncbi:hypothetical protein Tco_0276461 [Tanacetum coccineum]